MRYYVDCEFNGTGGQLLSVALVSQDNKRKFYETLPVYQILVPWVAENVMPVRHRRASERAEVTRKLGEFLAQDTGLITFVSDWPEDLVHVLSLTLTKSLERMSPPSYRLLVLHLPGFSAAAESGLPHNALDDAEALRKWCEEGIAAGPQGFLTKRDLSLLANT